MRKEVAEIQVSISLSWEEVYEDFATFRTLAVPFETNTASNQA